MTDTVIAKNPQHFQQYAHLLQYPQPAPDTASTNPAEEPPTPPPSTKPCCCEETHSRSASPSASQHGDKTPVSTVSKAVLASPEQLLYFLEHAPHLSALVSGHNTGGVAEEPASDDHNTDDGYAQSTNDMNKKKTEVHARCRTLTYITTGRVWRRCCSVPTAACVSMP